MSSVRYQRHQATTGTEFRIIDLPAELVPGARKAAFAFRDGHSFRDSHWSRTFPRGTPHVDRAWENFQRLIEPCLRQSAGIDPVPWAEALAEVCRRLAGTDIDWWLTGSAALAVRGIAVAPGDLDRVVSDEGAHRLGDLLLDGLIEPVAPADWFCRWWGRAMLGARVEWVGGIGPSADEPLPTDFGLVAAANLEAVRWQGHDLRVPPLDLQRAVGVRRGLTDRVRLIDTSPQDRSPLSGGACS
jgi:hypothetical protein